MTESGFTMTLACSLKQSWMHPICLHALAYIHFAYVISKFSSINHGQCFTSLNRARDTEGLRATLASCWGKKQAKEYTKHLNTIYHKWKSCKAATVKRWWFGVNIPRIQLLDLQVSELHFSSSPGLHIFHILVNRASNKTPDNALHRTVLFMHKVLQTWVSPINPAYSC